MKNFKLLSYLVYAMFFNTECIFSQSTDDKAFLLCKYAETSVPDSNNRQKLNYDVMGLEIGKKLSRFYSISNDEMIKTLEKQAKQNNSIDMSAINTPRNRRGKRRVIYKNYLDNNILNIENLGMQVYKFEEANPNFNWNILTDTIQILNQSCQKATCSFRGREYEAWFSSKISISEGPWKFNGLPGLILKIRDLKNDYAFEAISIEKINYIIDNPNTKAQKISQEQFKVLTKQFSENPSAFLNNGESSFTLTTPSTNPPKRPQNPMELTEK